MQIDMFGERPTQYETHAELIEAMHAMKDDPLYDTGNNMVIYRGNPMADLMVIGEAPGANEDQQGKPFVGKSGQLLDKILQAADFDTENDIYVTNVVFRRPPDNRDPTQEELDYYFPYLLESIRLVDPKVIILSGRFSMRVILNEKLGITKVRGTWYKWHDRDVMPVFHPAYLLRNQSRAKGSPKWLMWQDAQEIRRRYLELTQ